MDRYAQGQVGMIESIHGDWYKAEDVDAYIADLEMAYSMLETKNELLILTIETMNKERKQLELLNEECGGLNADNVRLREEIERLKEEVNTLRCRMDETDTEYRKLRKALEFYADGCDLCDNGETATVALKAEGAGKGE